MKNFALALVISFIFPLTSMADTVSSTLPQGEKAASKEQGSVNHAKTCEGGRLTLSCFKELPEAPLPRIEGDIRWKTQNPHTASYTAWLYGLKFEHFAKLNPEYAKPEQSVPRGTTLRVRAYDKDSVAISVGKCNKGRLINGIPFPESPQKRWFLRERRNTKWGTALTINTVRYAIDKTFEKYPDIEAFNIGDLSSPRGGALKPHKSHRSGRDIDISYILKEKNINVRHPENFRRASLQTLDIEKTWYFVETLLKTKNVDKIFIDRRFHGALKNEALKTLSPELVNMIFERSHNDVSLGIIMHSPGHTNHLHVRFRCSDEDKNCR